MESIKSGVLALLLTSGTVLGLGKLQSPHATVNDVTNPPKAYVVIDGKKIDAVINGYQWSLKEGAVTKAVIADAAFDPAKNLKPITAKTGSVAHLSFQQKPKKIQLDIWEHGDKSKQQHLTTTKFALPNKSGDYTFEITGYWGKDYVQYDFEVHVH